MLEFAIWITVGFISGSVPWAIIVGKLLVRGDIRGVGDGNPGATNAWKSGGWVPGILSTVLEIGKGSVPVYIAIQYLNPSSDATVQLGLALIAIAPVIGHAWSPFLRFKGGKALAASWGSWIGMTGGGALLVGCILLAIMHALQKNHAVTVTACLVGFFLVFLPTHQLGMCIASLWLMNIMIVIYKHRHEYSKGIITRNWIINIVGKSI